MREKFSCRSCEKITQPPAPFHVIPRARAGASLLAMILYAKFGEHQPLNRQSESYAREGIELDVSTLADWVGACMAGLAPLLELIRHHVLTGERVHGDDTTVPVLAQQKTVIGRVWAYVRDDRPFAGPDPPAALFFYSRNRNGEHPNRHLAGYAGILQADAYAGFGDLYGAKRKPGPITEAACWSHSRRKFFELADLGKSPLAVEAVRRIDAIFAIEREINGATVEQRLAVRQERVKPLVGEFEGWMLAERARLSRHADLAKQSITCSSAGRPSLAFSTMAASAYRTMPPSALCVASLSGAAHGYSPARIGEVSALPRCTPSSLPQNSTARIHRPGLPTYCVALPIIRPPSCTSSSPGTGSCAKPEPLPPDKQTIAAFAGCLRVTIRCRPSCRPAFVGAGKHRCKRQC